MAREVLARHPAQVAKTQKGPTASRLTFGRRLREERQKKGMTLEDLAEASGITWSYIAQVEVGRRNISVDNMHFLAAGVNLSLVELLR
ncbi:helix-turn-helix transcriptional regulator [uncultured Deinococcus sp.]|uniref:helix-turn-helix domain-containing protein n=1 Tax=uncultured Deinococcus sp. TaxID=158789 RepID=UPI0025FAF457|nr:helix-turn-helix transcriptional regulator [uncultured Deinococcus sp.]